MQKANPQYDLFVHSIRKKLGDVDGISVKFALDAIVRDTRTVLKDDSPDFIRTVQFSQEKGDEEKTILTFKRVR